MDKAGLPSQQDPPAMIDAIAAIEQVGHRVHRPSPYQLKIGGINFWPNTGKITIDPDKKYPERGLPAVLELIRAQYGLKL